VACAHSSSAAITHSWLVSTLVPGLLCTTIHCRFLMGEQPGDWYSAWWGGTDELVHHTVHTAASSEVRTGLRVTFLDIVQ
jgi:hypothetical protein